MTSHETVRNNDVSNRLDRLFIGTQEKVRSVIDLLSTPGVIDELVSVLYVTRSPIRFFQDCRPSRTRAKYFVTVPRIFKDYQKLQVNKRRRQPLAEYLNEQENLCMESLVTNHADDKQDGIIGESFFNKMEKYSATFICLLGRLASVWHCSN